MSGYGVGVRLTPMSPSQLALPAVTRTTAATMSEASPFLGANVPDDEELKAVFYQADTDLSGEIDREELVEQLFEMRVGRFPPAPFGPRLAALKAAAHPH